jgi:hypothetical protein
VKDEKTNRRCEDSEIVADRIKFCSKDARCLISSGQETIDRIREEAGGQQPLKPLQVSLDDQENQKRKSNYAVERDEVNDPRRPSRFRKKPAYVFKFPGLFSRAHMEEGIKCRSAMQQSEA